MRIALTLAITACAAAPLAGQVVQEKPATKAVQQKSEKAQELLKLADTVMKEVEKLRGWKFKREVKKGVYTEAELRKYITKALFEEEFAGGKLALHQWMLTSLGFLPAGMDLQKTMVDVLLNQVGGFYDPKRSSFFMMTKTAGYGDFVNRMLIAHELTHALDDQYFDLEALTKPGTDEHDLGFALGSVVEGSATVLMFRWQFAHMSEMNREKMMQVAASEEERSKVLLEAPPYFLTLIAKYMVGANFLTRNRGMLKLMSGQLTGLAGDIEHAMKNPPVSSEQILHPEKYWDPNKLDLPVKLVNEAAFVTKLIGDRKIKVAGKETLGEIHCAILGRRPDREFEMTRMMIPGYWTSTAGKGWGGDRVFLLEDTSKDPHAKGIVWLTWWDTEKDAEQFERYYTRYFGEKLGFKSARTKRLVTFAYGFARDDIGEIHDLATRAPVAKGNQRFLLSDPVDKR